MAGPLTETAKNLAGAATDPQFWDDAAGNATRYARAVTSPDFWRGVPSAAYDLVLPNSAPTTPGLPDADQLARMTRHEIQAVRSNPALSQQDQNYLGPFEHRASAREASGTPYGALQQTVAVPLYTLAKEIHNTAKLAGLNFPYGAARSQPSLQEMAQGFQGVWEGLTK